jgi:hypothetical protein
VLNPVGALVAAAQATALKPGRGAVAWTMKAPSTLAAALGQPLSLTTEKIVLLGT